MFLVKLSWHKLIFVALFFVLMSGPCCSQNDTGQADPSAQITPENPTDTDIPPNTIDSQESLPYSQVYAEAISDLADFPGESGSSTLVFDGQTTLTTRVYSSSGITTAPLSNTSCVYYAFILTDASQPVDSGLWAETNSPDGDVFVLVKDTLVNPQHVSQNAGNEYTKVDTEFTLDFEPTTTQIIANADLPQNIKDIIVASSWDDSLLSEILETKNFLVREWVILPDTDYLLTVTQTEFGDANSPDESNGAPSYSISYTFSLAQK